MKRSSFVQRLLAPIAALMLLCLYALTPYLPPDQMWVAYAPMILINAALALLFASTLRRGEENMIARFVRLIHGEVPEVVANYTRVLTRLWVALFASIAIVAFALALIRPSGMALVGVSAVPFALYTLFFVIEYAYRRRRFPTLDHASPLRIVRTLREQGLPSKRGVR